MTNVKPLDAIAMLFVLAVVIMMLPGCASIDKNYVPTASDRCVSYLNFEATMIGGVAEQCNKIWADEPKTEGERNAKAH